MPCFDRLVMNSKADCALADTFVCVDSDVVSGVLFPKPDRDMCSEIFHSGIGVDQIASPVWYDEVILTLRSLVVIMMKVG